MQSSLALTALLMGLAGGPHCIAMCGAACVALGQRSTGASDWPALGLFQLGRLLGYAALGALAAASLQALGWLTTHSAVFRPLWSLFHVALVVLGLLLLLQARQPVWLEQGGRRLWRSARGLAGRGGLVAPLLTGGLWAFLPCGLLYSALLVAALSNQPLQGAAVMALFAVGSGLALLLGPWLWLWLRPHTAPNGQWGVRLAGLALTLSSGWALWLALAHDAAPWCVTP